MKYEKNETQLDNINKAMIRYDDSRNKVYKMSHIIDNN